MTREVMKLIGIRLTDARKKLGLPRKQLSFRCGYSSDNTLTHFERGDYDFTPQNVAKLMWLSQFYEINETDLFKGLDYDRKTFQKAKKNYVAYITRFLTLRADIQQEREKNDLLRQRELAVKTDDRFDYAICKQWGNELLWFVKTKEISQSFTYDKLRVNVFERDVDKATKFETIADARRFVKINGMRIVRWRDYEAKKVKKFD